MIQFTNQTLVAYIILSMIVFCTFFLIAYLAVLKCYQQYRYYQQSNYNELNA